MLSYSSSSDAGYKTGVRLLGSEGDSARQYQIATMRSQAKKLQGLQVQRALARLKYCQGKSDGNVATFANAFTASSAGAFFARRAQKVAQRHPSRTILRLAPQQLHLMLARER
jgi:hypothetical protein